MSLDHAAPEKMPRRRAAVWAVPLALTLALGGYTGAAALTPLPDPEAALLVQRVQEFAVDAAATQAAVDSFDLPSAVGWLDDDEVWANDDQPHPLASITKIVTVLVGQEQEPLEVGADGPTYTWTDADVAYQDRLAELDGIAYPIPAGTEVTRRQMLTLALVPSANDFATAYAHSIFGDNAGFVAAVDDWAKRNGFDTLSVREPSGMSAKNVASAADIVRISRLALSDPAIAELVGTERATLPWGIGEVSTTNPLLGTRPGVIGVKTGRTEVAGYSLAAAATGEFGGRELTRIAVVFGRDSEAARAADAQQLLVSLAKMPELLPVTTEGESLGALTSVDGQTVGLIAGDTSELVLAPGELATVTTDVAAGTLTTAGPEGETTVPIRRDGSFDEVTLWWRITHPRQVFGL